MGLQVKIKKKLANFTLDVEFSTEHEVFALLGASGCGKSMTLKCIAGIEKTDEGLIILNGRTLYDSSKKINLPPQERKVGYMFQDYALFPNMTVLGNIMAGMGKRADKAKAGEYLRRFRLEELEQQYPASLSGGQKQRVAMARMLAAEPEVILLDEPFSALDSHLRWSVEQQMRQLLCGIDKPAIFVSHNRDEVYRMCSMVGCINRGRLEVVEPVREFFRNPKTKIAAELSGCKNISEVVISNNGTCLEASGWGCSFFFKEPVSADVGAVGIRAHYLHPLYGESSGSDAANILQIKEYQIIEDSFEWIFLFKVTADGDWLQWKTPKKPEEKLRVPQAFMVDEKDILLLKI